MWGLMIKAKILSLILVLLLCFSVHAGQQTCAGTHGDSYSIPSVEDIDTDWTDADPGDDMTANDTTITMTALSTRDTDSWWYKDFGANYFDGDFQIYLDFYLTTIGDLSYIYVGVTDYIDDADYIDDNNKNLIGFRHYRSTPDTSLTLREIYNSSLNSGGTLASGDTQYYISLYRDDDAGGGTAYLKVYISDADRTNGANEVLDTTLALSAAVTGLRYLMAPVTVNQGGTYTITGTISNIRVANYIWNP